MAEQRIEIYDVTLRDGAQGPRVKFSPEDQVRVVQALDEFGVSYIEGGWPFSSPKAAEIFVRARDIELKHALMAAFGSTHHPKSAPEDDKNFKALIDSQAPVLTIFAKTSPTHVTEVLRVTLEDNLRIVRDSVAYLKSQGRRVFLDAEHYFDGYKEDNAYALEVLAAAHDAGAEVLVLCDTNGGCMPWEIEELTTTVLDRFPLAQVGIHTHNDAGCGVAGTICAVRAGAIHVQGTINGYGERTGNANLISIIANLQLKMGLPIVPPENMERLTHLSHLVAELANMQPRESDPYVGRDAFTHKGGMHADAVKKLKTSYEHIVPETVGNTTHVSVSEMAGRTSLLQKAAELGIELDRDAPETREVLDTVKSRESEGYEFEAADASLELLLRKARGECPSFFRILGHRVAVAGEAGAAGMSEAIVRLELPDGTVMHTVAEGHGPVDALNTALRKALEPTYPELRDVHLEDYKVRILDSQAATAAKTRVLIESSDADTTWDTVGVSENIITASYLALVDSIEYKLYRARAAAARGA
jgi:2-isopropylmalate synthase